MQLSFRIDKRPGESHLALDGKNKKEQKAVYTSALVVAGETRLKDMDVFGNTTGKADARHRTSPKGLEVFVDMHACLCSRAGKGPS